MQRIIRYITAILFCSTLYTNIEASNVELKQGLWTGFNDINSTFVMLDINDNSKHYLFELNIISGFKFGKRFTFTDEQIKCNEIQCNISLDKNGGYTSNIAISPYLTNGDVLSVFDTQINKEINFLATSVYKLRKENGKSAANRFINLYRDKVEQLYTTSNDGLKGLWIGVWNIDGRNKQLVVLDIDHDNNGNLIRLTGNIPNNNATPIQSADVVINGKNIELRSNGITGITASIATLTFRTEDNLSGRLRTQMSDALVFDGGISLNRIKEPKRR